MSCQSSRPEPASVQCQQCCLAELQHLSHLGHIYSKILAFVDELQDYVFLMLCSIRTGLADIASSILAWFLLGVEAHAYLI